MSLSSVSCCENGWFVYIYDFCSDGWCAVCSPRKLTRLVRQSEVVCVYVYTYVCVCPLWLFNLIMYVCIIIVDARENKLCNHFRFWGFMSQIGKGEGGD